MKVPLVSPLLSGAWSAALGKPVVTLLSCSWNPVEWCGDILGCDLQTGSISGRASLDYRTGRGGPELTSEDTHVNASDGYVTISKCSHWNYFSNL